MNIKYLLKEIGSAWKDLLLLILGIYLALWLEGKVQDWQEDQRQKDYLYRLSVDLNKDMKLLLSVKQRLENKLEKLQQGLEVIAADGFSVARTEDRDWVLKTAEQVNNYHFFTPHDFTFVSMRESGDFKLIREEKVQNMLLSTYDNYKLLETLQENYIQGLDDYFIPLWLQSFDVLRGEIVDKDLIESPRFSNMILFAINETNNRHDYIKHIIDGLDESAVTLRQLSGKGNNAAD